MLLEHAIKVRVRQKNHRAACGDGQFYRFARVELLVAVRVKDELVTRREQHRRIAEREGFRILLIRRKPCFRRGRTVLEDREAARLDEKRRRRDTVLENFYAGEERRPVEWFGHSQTLARKGDPAKRDLALSHVRIAAKN